MNEKQPKNTEYRPDIIQLKDTHNSIKSDSSEKTQSQESVKAESKKTAEAARAEISNIASEIDRNQVADNLSKDKADADILWNSRELKEHTYNQTLTSVRNKLNKPEKTLSKIIHKPVIEKASDAASITIARPSGILFGGIFSFIGSLMSYILAKKLGGELKYSVFAVFFVGGFILGLLVELAIRLARARSIK